MAEWRAAPEHTHEPNDLFGCADCFIRESVAHAFARRCDFNWNALWRRADSCRRSIGSSDRQLAAPAEPRCDRAARWVATLKKTRQRQFERLAYVPAAEIFRIKDATFRKEAPRKKMKSFARLATKSSAIRENLYRNRSGQIKLLLQL